MTNAGCGTGGCSAQCVNIAGVTACGVNEYHGALIADGAPCGVYVGPTSPGYVQSLQGSTTYPVDIDMAARHILPNWPTLGYEARLAMCCTPTSCGIISVSRLFINQCNPGACALKCAGDAHHGICSTRCSDSDIGQFFLLNADVPLPTTSASDAGSETAAASSTGTFSNTRPSSAGPNAPPSATPLAPQSSNTQHPTSQLPQNSGSDASRSLRIPEWSIAAIAVLTVLASVVALLCIRRHRRRRSGTVLAIPNFTPVASMPLQEAGSYLTELAAPPPYSPELPSLPQGEAVF
ncbi:hypothetical protein AURDEDRAFT_128562 [Auricularia subglabra TFB-10046 SS5]|nr:hypothetical protein AURDEDRAFT_128562 [Auricularia subglabra TFB-10046 SS5]